MPEASPRPDHHALEATALRYAARDLPPSEAEAFESQLADDQSARDALSEAVRLSAAALGQDFPVPDHSFRALIRERLRPVRAWWPAWLSRRAYRGHPFVWAGLGAGVVAASTLIGLDLAGRDPASGNESSAPRATTTVAVSTDLPEPSSLEELVSAGSSEDGPPHPADHLAAGACGPDDDALKTAEIWAELSTPDHVEKTHEIVTRWRQHVRDLHAAHPSHLSRPATVDSQEP